ncbi:ABC transporter ATP-binding protein [Paenibacillus senegalensis]|uniref:ABC transporter ATP-binding protein n=1 Tax=Paenibacillus senegalensis TaxID=1465766 RepID=UPI00028897A2|nr:ABC transporter ATP-binding protein [Paenibacillus senegalensis]
MWGVIRQFAGFLRPSGWRFTAFLLSALIEIIVLALAPLSFKFMIDEAIEPNNIHAFWLILAVLGIAGTLGVSCGWLSDRILAKISAMAQQKIRLQLFKRIQRLDTRSSASGANNEIVTRFTVDLPAVDAAMISILTIGLQSLVIIVISTAVLFTLQWGMALVIMAGASIIYLAPYLLGSRARAAFADYRNGLDKMAGDVQESLEGRNVIQGFSLQKSFISRFEERLSSLFISQYRKNKVSAAFDRLPIVSLLAVNFTIIGFGSYLALNGSITLGALVAFFTIYTSMGNSVYNLTAILPSFANAQVSLERLSKLLDDKQSVLGKTEDAIPVTVGELNREGFVENVTETANNRAGQAVVLTQPPFLKADKLRFSYHPGEPVLDGLTFTIPAGTMAAFVGPSGSGKSTILHMLLGLLQQQSGSLTLDQVEFSRIDGEAMRQSVGVVFQESYLFRGTLLYNLKLGKPEATLDEVIEAAQQADIHEFITRLPQGYETLVEEAGSNLSGGQKQRIALARALLRKPPLLLLDEITASLDPISEAAVTSTIRKLTGRHTIIIVSHRLSTIAGADQIFVLKAGRISESGSHLELLKNNGLYASMWSQQMEQANASKAVR